MSWLDEHQPADVGHCLIHNDFRFDNIVLAADDPTRPIGVLDWEMATVGDPLMDLGGTLAYWVQPTTTTSSSASSAASPRNLPGMFSRAEMVAYYCERTGLSPTRARPGSSTRSSGCSGSAVIAQQIYYRYFHGQTTNEAYAIFGPAARFLEQRCRSIIALARSMGG